MAGRNDLKRRPDPGLVGIEVVAAPASSIVPAARDRMDLQNAIVPAARDGLDLQNAIVPAVRDGLNLQNAIVPVDCRKMKGTIEQKGTSV